GGGGCEEDGGAGGGGGGADGGDAGRLRQADGGRGRQVEEGGRVLGRERGLRWDGYRFRDAREATRARNPYPHEFPIIDSGLAASRRPGRRLPGAQDR